MFKAWLQPLAKLKSLPNAGKEDVMVISGDSIKCLIAFIVIFAINKEVAMLVATFLIITLILRT